VDVNPILLSQRPDFTGSGIYIQAMLREDNLSKAIREQIKKIMGEPEID